MRVLPSTFALVLAAAALTGACGGDDAGDSETTSEAACTLLDRMADHAHAVEEANVADPEAFADVLDQAIEAYTADLERLRDVTPDELDEPIDDLEAAMTDHKFDEAVTARAPIDEFAATECAPPAAAPES
jgi:hypothetical protein